MVESSLKRVGYGALTFASCFAYCSIWIWQGIDFTDEGYNLTNQWMLLHGSENYQFRMAWLSDLVGAAWLGLIGDPGLLGARVGGAIMIATIALASYSILTAYYSSGRAWISTLASVVIIYYRFPTIIEYNLVPTLFATVGCGAVLASQSWSNGLARRALWGIIAGAMLSLAIFARFPMILGLVLPAVPLLIVFRPRDQRPNWVASLTVVGVTLISLVVVAVLVLGWLWYVGDLRKFVAGVTAPHPIGHSVPALFAMYLVDSVAALEHSIALFALMVASAFAMEFAARRSATSRMRTLQLLVFYFLAMATCLVTVRLVGTRSVDAYFGLTIPLMFWLLGVCCAISVYRQSNDADADSLLQLFAVSLTLPVVLMAGSNNGLFNLRFGMGLILPAVLMTLPGQINNIVARQFTDRRVDSRHICIVWSVILVSCAFALRFEQPYRDLGNRLRLTVEPRHPRLRSVYTTAERAASINGLFAELDRRVRRGDYVLAYDNIPMIHYLTQALPALNNSWPAIEIASVQDGRLRQFGHDRPLPRFAIRSSTNPLDPAWAVTETKPLDKATLAGIAKIDKVLEILGYREVWSNHDFAILEREGT